ncbi:MAG: phospholipid carrier-dependent glycosyltransferase [Acidobacteriota bacterium]|nr:phospholipid carrier-dependent glycosyltransferase [Acidobacteriota bacterium]
MVQSRSEVPALVRIAPWAALVAVLVLGFWNLGGWMMNDDEGAYLYDAWRVGLGEVPYRDFSLVQTPLAFGVVGGLFSLIGPSVWAARAFSFLFVLGAAVLLFMSGRRSLGLKRGVAAAGAGIFLLNKHVFFLGRSFLPDNLMLLGAAAMLYAALRAENAPDGSRTAGRAAFQAGIFAGAAALAKLNGVFLFAGYGLYLAVSMLGKEARRAAWGRAWRAAAGFGLSFGLPFGLILAFVPGAFRFTLGFHLASGGGEAAYSAGLAADRLGRLVGNHNYGLFALAIVGIWAAWHAAPRTGEDEKRPQRRPRWAWLLLAAAGAACLPVLLPGKYYIRYVLPAFLPLALFFAVGLDRIRRPGRFRAAALAVAAVPVLLCLGPTLSPAKIAARDAETGALARLVQSATRDGQFVFGDDPMINMLARRPCPPGLVDVSGAMVRSGWVTAARIVKECEAAGVGLVFIERGHSAHHLAALPDAAALRAYLDREFRFWRTIRRQFLDVDIYLRK